MQRRRYLAWFAAGAANLAGCSGGATSGTNGSSPVNTATPAAAGPSTTATASGRDPALPVPKDQLLLAGFKDSIPAITGPAFAADWSGIRLNPPQEDISPDFDFELAPRLGAESMVIGLERRGTARAYPLKILNWFEVVNDSFPREAGGEEPVLVSYCPLCRSGLAAERTVRDQATIFGVSGLLYRDNLVLYDEATRSLWSQVRAQAIRGPMTGSRLSLLPSTLTTWSEWQRGYPDTQVLLPPPISTTVAGEAVRDVSNSPYGNYENASRIGVGLNRLNDDPLHPKAIVIGVRSDGVSRAYPLAAVREAGGVVNDLVGEKPVVVAAVEASLVAYDRRVGGQVRTFGPAEGAHMRAAGSRWSVRTGRAVDGPLQGQQLSPATSMSAMYWFAWMQFNPDTEIWSPAG